ncbi:glycoside hydrolase family 5 protein [Sphingomonas qomolangmaensis]|uniref:Glycoside hydrolase family 5 protein n=1 Tax=Sphingomonas qomolangmaensis TaxID=2918765 RepID=A0ABY5L6J1_9SPHN|nr:glycoside hydrolase family 5 protein [Sphingomonas qomolangmaensis]UUL82580.1 glycoside hydrolase family 5 protein [Sphingomonas qomolangmaensis]
MSLFWSQWSHHMPTRSWIGRLATDWRIDVVRVPLGVENGGYLSHPEREITAVFAAVDAAIEHGLYAVIDWHSHKAHTRSAIEFFDRIAQRYAALSNIIYETWNEPTTEDWGTIIKPHHEAIVSRLRDRGIANIAVCGTGHHCTDLASAAASQLQFHNIAYSVHFYAATHRQGLRSVVEAALSKGVCPFVSEFGLCEASGDGAIDIAEASRWLSFLNDRGISHLNWALSDKDESCSALASPSRLWSLGRSRNLSASGRAMRRYLRNISEQG